MNFLLIYPPGDEKVLETDKTSSLFAPPLGLLYISSILRRQDHKVNIIDARAEKINKKNIFSKVKSSDAVGISIPTFSLKNAEKLINIIRRINEDVFIFGGGTHCSLFPKETLDMMDLDAVIKGEGEKAIKHLSNHLKDSNLNSIPGIYYKENGKVIKGKAPEVIDDLDSIPFPSHSLVNKYDYGFISNFKPFKKNFTAMITSRGCPYRCSFCSRDLFIGRNYRQRTAENVLEEIEFVTSLGYNGIIFVDDNFLLNKKRTLRIMDGIINRDLDLTMIVEGARVDAVDKELYKKMWEAGVRLISFGIESGNQDVLDFYNKRITLKQIRKAVNMANESGFFTVASFILGAPFETKDHFKNTINFACLLPLDFVEFYLLEYRVGSQLWKQAIKDGKIQKNQYFVRGCKENDLGIMSKEELEKWQKKAYKSFYLRPEYFFREIFKLLKNKKYHLLKAGVPLIKKI